MNQPDLYKILVVDDDVEDHLILLEYFTEAGMRDKVKFSENGQKAIEFLENIEDDALLPSLIIMDLNMPILNGTQTLQHLKRTGRFRGIPIIIFSTSENEIEKRKCLNLGALDYVVKPTTFEDGQKMVKRFMSYIS